MKIFYIILLFSTSCFSQNIPTEEDVKEYLIFISSKVELPINQYDSTDDIYKLLENHKVGDTIINNFDIYQIVKNEEEIPLYSAGYIYFDGKKLSYDEINKLREIVIAKYNNGVPFKDLIAEYNMDGNPDAANLLFSDGQMVPEFENAVKSNNPGRIFTVDVPGNKWYYVAIRNEGNYSKKVILAKYARYPTPE